MLSIHPTFIIIIYCFVLLFPSCSIFKTWCVCHSRECADQRNCGCWRRIYDQQLLFPSLDRPPITHWPSRAKVETRKHWNVELHHTHIQFVKLITCIVDDRLCSNSIGSSSKTRPSKPSSRQLEARKPTTPNHPTATSPHRQSYTPGFQRLRPNCLGIQQHCSSGNLPVDCKSSSALLLQERNQKMWISCFECSF